MYPFTFEGKEYNLLALSASIKQAFVQWLKPRYLAEAKAILDPGEYIVERERVIAGSLFWSNSMSVAVATAVYSGGDGERQLLRLLLGSSGNGLTDAVLDAMLAAKEDDASPLAIAWGLVLEESDAKKPSTMAADLTLTPI